MQYSMVTVYEPKLQNLYSLCNILYVVLVRKLIHLPYHASSINPTTNFRTSEFLSFWNAATSSKKESRSCGSWWIMSSCTLAKVAIFSFSEGWKAAVFRNSTTCKTYTNKYIKCWMVEINSGTTQVARLVAST